MLRLRKSADRGHLNHGWLDTFHTFSFGEYVDPNHHNFRTLRVMNEDRVAPGQGFGMHPHRDMEIVTYVLSGALEHKDSMGNGETLRPGEFQRMSAGRGLLHSEFNPSPTEAVHLYQIWIMPEKKSIEPSYEQKAFAAAERAGKWRLVASPDGAEGSLVIHTDARIYLTTLAAGQTLQQAIPPGRHAWVQTLRGRGVVNGQAVAAGDGVALSEESALRVEAAEETEFLFFDLP